jgi:DNA-binding NarL/FixJ family response regulator
MYRTLYEGLSGGPSLDTASANPSLSWATNTNIFSVLFQKVCVVLQLSTVQQRLLLHALNGRADEEIAEAEGVTLDAVKKRWSNLFDEVSAKNGSLLPGVGENGRRGAEKRGKLPDYIRQHPQELRPTP